MVSRSWLPLLAWSILAAARFHQAQAAWFGTAAKHAKHPTLVPPFALPNTTAAATNATTTSTIPPWKQKLPYPLNNRTWTLQRLSFQSEDHVVELYLMGTAHVSNDSSLDVRLLLENVQPSYVFVELCAARLPLLLPTAQPPPSNKKWWQRSGGQPGMMSATNTMLSSLQQNFAETMGVELGGEFRVAFDYWNATRTPIPCQLILGDRPVRLTMVRAWESLNAWGKIRLMAGLFFAQFIKPNEQELREWILSILESGESDDVLTKSMEELERHFPTLAHVILKERDAYMACKLHRICTSLLTHMGMTPDAPKVVKIVGIVGAGHVGGMMQWLTMGNGRSMQENLEQVVSTKKQTEAEFEHYAADQIISVDHDLVMEMMEEMAAGEVSERPAGEGIEELL